MKGWDGLDWAEFAEYLIVSFDIYEKVDLLKLPVAVYTAGSGKKRTGKLDLVTPALASIIGFSCDDLLGRDPAFMVPSEKWIHTVLNGSAWQQVEMLHQTTLPVNEIPFDEKASIDNHSSKGQSSEESEAIDSSSESSDSEDSDVGGVKSDGEKAGAEAQTCSKDLQAQPVTTSIVTPTADGPETGSETQTCSKGLPAQPVTTLIVTPTTDGHAFWNLLTAFPAHFLDGTPCVIHIATALEIGMPEPAIWPTGQTGWNVTQASLLEEYLQPIRQDLQAQSQSSWEPNGHLVAILAPRVAELCHDMIPFFEDACEGGHFVAKVGGAAAKGFEDQSMWMRVFEEVRELRTIWNECDTRKSQNDDGMTIACAVSDFKSRDCPLVYVSPGFEELTGYKAEYACGRNCRFLQPNDPARNRAFNGPELVRMRYFCTKAKSGQIFNLLLNEKYETGEPFWNLLYMQHLTLRVDGEWKHYIFGLQTNLVIQKETMDAIMPWQWTVDSLAILARLREILRENEAIFNPSQSSFAALANKVTAQWVLEFSKEPPSWAMQTLCPEDGQRSVSQLCGEFPELVNPALKGIVELKKLHALFLNEKVLCRKSEIEPKIVVCAVLDATSGKGVCKSPLAASRRVGLFGTIQSNDGPIGKADIEEALAVRGGSDGQTHMRLRRSSLDIVKSLANKLKPQCKLIFVSDSFSEMTGHDPQVMIGQTYWQEGCCLHLADARMHELVNGQALLRMEEFCQSGHNPGEAMSIMLLSRRQDGTCFWQLFYLTHASVPGRRIILAMHTTLEIPLPDGCQWHVQSARGEAAAANACALGKFVLQCFSPTQSCGTQESISAIYQFLTFLKLKSIDYVGDSFVPKSDDDVVEIFECSPVCQEFVRTLPMRLGLFQPSLGCNEELLVTIHDASVVDSPLVYVSDAFVKRIGQKREWCLGRNLRFLQPRLEARRNAFNGAEKERLASLNTRSARECQADATLPLEGDTDAWTLSLQLNENAAEQPFWNLLFVEHILFAGRPYAVTIHTVLDPSCYHLRELFCMGKDSLLELARLREALYARASELSDGCRIQQLITQCISSWSSSSRSIAFVRWPGVPGATSAPKLLADASFGFPLPRLCLELTVDSVLTEAVPDALDNGCRHFQLVCSGFSSARSSKKSDDEEREQRKQIDLFTSRIADMLEWLHFHFYDYALAAGITFGLRAQPHIVGVTDQIQEVLVSHGFELSYLLMDACVATEKDVTTAWTTMSSMKKSGQLRALGLYCASTKALRNVQKCRASTIDIIVAKLHVRQEASGLVPDGSELEAVVAKLQKPVVTFFCRYFGKGCGLACLTDEARQQWQNAPKELLPSPSAMILKIADMHTSGYVFRADLAKGKPLSKPASVLSHRGDARILLGSPRLPDCHRFILHEFQEIEDRQIVEFLRTPQKMPPALQAVANLQIKASKWCHRSSARVVEFDSVSHEGSSSGTPLSLPLRADDDDDASPSKSRSRSNSKFADSTDDDESPRSFRRLKSIKSTDTLYSTASSVEKAPLVPRAPPNPSTNRRRPGRSTCQMTRSKTESGRYRMQGAKPAVPRFKTVPALPTTGGSLAHKTTDTEELPSGWMKTTAEKASARDREKPDHPRLPLLPTDPNTPRLLGS